LPTLLEHPDQEIGEPGVAPGELFLPGIGQDMSTWGRPPLERVPLRVNVPVALQRRQVLSHGGPGDTEGLA